MKNTKLIEAWFEVGTKLMTAGAIDPKSLECMVQTSGKGDDSPMRNWFCDLGKLMQGDDLKNLYYCHIHTESMTRSEANSIGHRLRGFWKRVDEARDYHESFAARVYRYAA